MSRWGSALALCALLLFFVSCASPKHRAKKNPEAYAALHDEWKQLVMKGKIAEGMGTDALFIAMGNPSWKKPTQFMDREVSGWVYTRLDSYDVPNYDYHVVSANDGSLYVTEYYAPLRQTRRIPSIVVFVENDRVVGWQDLSRY